MFIKWTEEALLHAHCTQLLEQAVRCANTEASATVTAANASTSEKDDSDFFNFIKFSNSTITGTPGVPEQNRTELSNVGQTSRNQTTFCQIQYLFTSSASDERPFGKSAFVVIVTEVIWNLGTEFYFAGHVILYCISSFKYLNTLYVVFKYSGSIWVFK